MKLHLILAVVALASRPEKELEAAESLLMLSRMPRAPSKKGNIEKVEKLLQANPLASWRDVQRTIGGISQGKASRYLRAARDERIRNQGGAYSGRKISGHLNYLASTDTEGTRIKSMIRKAFKNGFNRTDPKSLYRVLKLEGISLDTFGFYFNEVRRDLGEPPLFISEILVEKR